MRCHVCRSCGHSHRRHLPGLGHPGPFKPGGETPASSSPMIRTGSVGGSLTAVAGGIYGAIALVGPVAKPTHDVNHARSANAAGRFPSVVDGGALI